MKETPGPPAGTSGVRRAAAFAAAGYAALGFLWIRFSDEVVRAVADPERMTRLQSAKGIAFVFISAVYVFAVGIRLAQRAGGGDQRVRGGRPPAGAWVPILVFSALSLALAGTGLLLHRQSVEAERTNALASLSISADAKAARIAAWLEGLEADTRLLATDPRARGALALPEPSARADALAALRRELERYRQAYPDRSVLVLDAAGEVRETVGPAVQVGPRVRAALGDVTARGKPAIAELRAEAGEPLVLKTLAAVPDPGGARAPVGFVLIAVDLAEQLGDLTRPWPASRRTEETVLARRSGAEVVFLTDTGKGGLADVRLRRLPASGDFLAARALRGDGPIEQGVDYLGVPVLGVARTVPDTDWVLVVKVPEEEVLGPLRRRLVWAALFFGALLLAAAVVTRLWWNALSARQAARERELEAERDAMARRFEWLSESSNDIVLQVDRALNVAGMNDRAREAYGYAREELVGRPAGVLCSGGTETAGAELEHLFHLGGAQVEAVHRRKDGSLFPVDVSGRTIEVDGRPFLQLVIRDITERRRAEERIRRLNQLYALLSRANAAIVRTQDPEELAAKVCEIAVEAVGFQLAWISAAEGKARLRAIAAAGPAAGLVQVGPLTLDPSAPSGRGPTAEALREGRIVLSNDYLADGSTVLWHDEARRLGLRSVAAFPIPGKDGPRGCLSVGAGEAGYFDEEIVGLLSGLAEDLGFALEVHDREEARRRADEALRVTARRLIDAETLGRTGSFLADFATGELNWSDGHFRLLGEEPGAFRPTTEALLARVHPEDREKMDDISRAGWEGTPAGSHEYRVVDPSGAVRWLSATSEVLADSTGRPAAVFGAVRDVTEQKLAAERQRLWSHVLEGSADGVLVAGPDRRALIVNRAFERMSGYAAEEVVGRAPSFLESVLREGAAPPDVWEELESSGRWSGEVRIRRGSGAAYPAGLSITAVKDEGGATTHYVAIFTDLTERFAAQERIDFLSRRDPLTRLVNRAGLEAELDRALADARAAGETVALTVLDIDRFSGLNESLGGPVGDEALRAVAARLAASVHARDILARVGPDEFGVAFVSLKGPSGCAAVVAKVRGVFAREFEAGGRSIPLTASIGVAVFPGDGEDARSLMRSADAALRHAKAGEGGGFESFRPELTLRSMKSLDTETRLRRALADGELDVHFQPQVEVETGRVVGAEALVRWIDPERGLVLPDQFIPVAEERGLIVPLGEWVLRAAATRLRKWLDDGLAPLVVAANVSAAQFRSPGFESRLVAILEETGVPPELIELEVTESILARDVDAAAALLGRLRDRGVSISIDDFGTGYSSLGYLRRFPLRRLKIDKGFVAGIWVDPSAAAIVRTVIGIARGLGLKVVAEGVEEKRQYSFLRFHGCDEAQGFFVKRPVPEEAFLRFVAAGAFDPDVAPAA